MSAPPPLEENRDSAQNLIRLADEILRFSPIEKLPLALDPPPWIEEKLPRAQTLLLEVREIVHRSGVEVEYFDVSVARYRHSLAACLSRDPDARVLEVGAAPGHISIALHLAGFRPVGVNLNALWRATYPGAEWLDRLEILEHDVEKEPLPYDDGSFDLVVFTEVLEHVAVSDPVNVLRELRRVLAPGGLLVLSTPNVCNISNLLALATGLNVFWPPDLFYGSLDRHNREYTPEEVRTCVEAAGLRILSLYGINADNNWRTGAEVLAYSVIGRLGDRHPLLRNTAVCLASV